MTLSPPTRLDPAAAAAAAAPSSAGAKVARRRSLAISRDLFANGERAAVRCRPSTIYMPDEREVGAFEGLAGAAAGAGAGEEVGWEEFFRSSSPPPPRRSSLQHHPLAAPPLPPLASTSAAFAFSPSLAQTATATASQPRRHSEQAPGARPGFARSSHTPASTRAALPGPSPPLVELLASPPPLIYAPSPSSLSSSLAPNPHSRPRPLSTAAAAAPKAAKPAAAPSAVKRKPVPALSLEDPDEFEVVTDPRWDGKTPPLVPLGSAVLVAPTATAATAKGVVDFRGYGFPPVAGAKGAEQKDAAMQQEVVSAPAAADADDEVDTLASGLEEKVRRMSLETTQSGATGLGLGLRPAEEALSEVWGRRKTLAEVKAEKERERERRRSEDANAGRVQAKGEMGVLASRRGTDGMLGIVTGQEARFSTDSASLPPISPAYSSSHGSTTSAPSRPTSATTTTSSHSSASLPLTASSTHSSSAAATSAAASKRPTFRPFALVKQHSSRPLPAHEAIISPPSSSRATLGSSKRHDEDLVDAWMDIMLGGGKSERAPVEEEDDDLDTPLAAQPAFVFGASSTAAPPAPCLPSTASPARVLGRAETGLGVYGTETVASLANSLPPLVYSATPSLAAKDVQPREEDTRMHEDSSDANDEYVDASEGRPSLDTDVEMVSHPSPPVKAAPLSSFLNLAVPRRLNKRSASASFLDKTISPPLAFSSVPASPTFTAAFSAVFRPTSSAVPRVTPAAVGTPTSPPIAQPAAKRQHLSSSTSPPFPSAPTLPTIVSKTAPATAGGGGKNKPLPPRPPRPPKSARRSGSIRTAGGVEPGEMRRRKSAERIREGGAAMARAEKELESCPVLLDRFVTNSSDSGDSSVEAIKLEGNLSDHRPLVTILV
ncbi:hypothetical protein JCM6882_009735 [Rhodosporidiobolus microsporus]